MKNRPNSQLQNVDGLKPPDSTAFQNGRRYGFGVFFLLLLLLVCYISVWRISGYRGYVMDMADPDIKRQEVEGFIKIQPQVWNELVRYGRNINRYYIYHRDFYSVSNDEKVTPEDMAEDMAVINRDFDEALAKAAQKYNDVIMDKTKGYPEQMAAKSAFDKEVTSLLDSYSLDIESAKEIQLRDKIANFVAIENYLDTTREFTYYITDTVLDKTFTNIVASDIDSYMANDTYMNVSLTEIGETFNGIPLNDSFADNGISGYIMIPKDQPQGSAIKTGIDEAVLNQEIYESSARSLMYRYLALFVATVALIILYMWRSFVPHLNRHIAGYMAAVNVYLKIPAFLKFFLAFYVVAGIELFIEWPQGMLSFYLIDILSVCLNIFNMYIMALFALFSLTYIYLIVSGQHKLKDEYESRLFLRFVYSFSVMRKTGKYAVPVVAFIILVSLIFSTFI
ncbi:MAG: hypothetical protein LBU94_01120, partial [Clostridiales bacterium]|nr:hypothetical protein [Clostridiales bacterium]